MLRAAFAALSILLAAGQASSDVLETIIDRGVIRIGVRGDAPPFSYLDERTEPAGLAVRLCEEVVARMAESLDLDELEIEYRVVSAEGRFQALNQGLTDLHCGPASATLKRRETIDFSVLYFVDGAAIASPRGRYEKIMQTRTGKFGVVAGTTTEVVLKSFVEENQLDASIVRFPTHRRGLKALANEEIDGYAGDRAILLFNAGVMGLLGDVVVRDEVLSFEPYALAMASGEQGLRLAVDRALSSIYESGKIYELIERELGTFEISEDARAIYNIVALPE